VFAQGFRRVKIDDQGGLVPSTAFTLSVKLTVQPEDLEKAQKLMTPAEPNQEN
jgi:hypothetical protein